MPRRTTRQSEYKQYTDLSGGLNRLTSASKVADKDSPSLQDIEYTESGFPSKRRGTDLYGDSKDGRVLGDGSFYTSSGRTRLRVSGTTLQKYVTGTWTDIAGVAFTADKVANFVQAKNAIYSHNGTDTMAKYDGTTLSQPAHGVIGKFGIYYASRHVVAGNSTYPSRLYFSSSKSADNFTGLSGTATAGGASTLTDSGQTWTVNEFQNLKITITAGTGTGQIRTISSNTTTQITVSEAWTTAPDNTSQYSIEGGDTLDVAKDDGQRIMGLAKFEERLVVFKEFSVYELTFDSNGLPTVQLAINSNGCVSHRSIDNVENDIFYLANDGVRSYGYVANIPGVRRTNKISIKVTPELENINPAYAEGAAAIYHDNKYILAFPQGSSTINNRVAVLHMLYGAWSIWTGINANCFNEFIDTDNKLKLYYGADDSGQTYQMLVANYSDGSGTAIPADYYTKQLDFGTFGLKKRVNRVDVQFRSLTGTVSIDVIVDGATTTKAATLSSTFSGKDGYRTSMYRSHMYRQDNGSTAAVVATDDVRHIKVNKDCRTLQLRIHNSNVDETFTFMAFAVSLKRRSVNRLDSTKIIY